MAGATRPGGRGRSWTRDKASSVGSPAPQAGAAFGSSVSVLSARRSHPRWRRATAFAVASLAATACSGAASSDALPTGHAFYSTIAKNGVSHEYTVSATTDVVAIDAVDELGVKKDNKKDIVLEDIRPLRIDPGLELLDVRVAFRVWHHHGLQGPDGEKSDWPGNVCTDTWPPKALIGLYPVKGLRGSAGDGMIPTYFTRARRAGDWSISGLRVVYRQGGRRFQQVTRTFSETIYARNTEDEVRDATKVYGGKCNPKLPYGFLNRF